MPTVLMYIGNFFIGVLNSIIYIMFIVLMYIGNMFIGALISQNINDKIYDICRYIAGKKYVKDKNKKLSLPKGVKVLSFTLKWNSILNLVCGSLFLIIGLYFLSGWYKVLFIFISMYQFYESKQNFDTFFNKTKMEHMVKIGFLLG